jgi:hypothetical protein
MMDFDRLRRFLKCRRRTLNAISRSESNVHCRVHKNSANKGTLDPDQETNIVPDRSEKFQTND